MSTRVDVEEIETTKSEKLLAVVLAAFLLIGGVWAYEKVDDYVRDAMPTVTRPSADDRAALDRLQAARTRLAAASDAHVQARDDLELSREAYRTALDAGRPARTLELRYRRAQAAFEQAQANVRQAERAVAAAEPEAEAANRNFAASYERREDRRALITFALRLALVLALMSFGYTLLARLRRRQSRYLPLGLAFVGFSAVLALVLAADYITDYVDPLDLGPLVLALVGIGATVLAFAALQRYLARRIPHRRVRRRECPFCGYPVHQNTRCEGCGRQVIAECTTCSAQRRVGTLHCGACGAS